jgi:nucleotide-binding universal stress UspA family protein
MGDPVPHSWERTSTIQRLLLVADVAVAGVEELPPSVREIIAASAEVHVITPTLPGRLAWLTDEVDPSRHVADERLDTVLEHMHALGANVSGEASRGSLLTVIADAVARFNPDHVLLALRSPDHANWQEHGVISHIEKRFGLPVTTYAVDVTGHTSSATGPVILCYDGSEGAARAIRRAGELFAGAKAVVVTIWHPTAGVGSLAASDGDGVAGEGARLAQEAGLDAESIAVESAGPVWKTILDTADAYQAATIVMGSRGLAGVRSKLLGSVSSAVVQHAGRPTLVLRDSVHDPD